ncbi:phasin family protein [Stakelama tenebrarum]|uniref:Phasin family protein n=1 Tax=Stakelama tenebrarum TaxID=2711215 RepID=A0A6G6YAS3_9SPHN|nr:phasin family protein [Sphingosinithalassobacter tenebrarum]QIG81676.1 phasin family protein [Sphingosinithalassobacter tenebrarum]
MASKGPKQQDTAAPKPAQPKKPAATRKKTSAPAAAKAEAKPAETAAAPVAAAAETTPQETAKIETAPVPTGTPEPAAKAEAPAAINEEVIAMEATAETTINRAQAMFSDFNDRTKAAVEKSTKMAEEMNDFAKGNVEALVESGKITAKGFESMGQEAAEFGRKSFEEATAAFKNMASVKTPADFFKLQSDYVRGAFDAYVAEASKTTEAMLKLAGDASQPISSRFAVAADKAKAVA